MTTLEEMMERYETVLRSNCRNCGNPWWFDMKEMGLMCTMCSKTNSKATGEIEESTDDAKKREG